MNQFIKTTTLLLVLSFLSSCTASRNNNGNTNCNTFATVKDFTGLDGCKFLLILDNGDKYLPAKINDAAFVLKDEQKIKFGYKELKDQISICMAENKIVAVTCIEEVK